MTTPWTPDSWRTRPAKHMPVWPTPTETDAIIQRLQGYPPLVFADEARALTAALGDVAHGRGFLLQGGDCAESFAGFR